YEKRRVEATEGLLDAAGNITYGEAEKGPLRRLLNALGPYEGAVARSLVLHGRGHREGALARHRAADRDMQAGLLPAAGDPGPAQPRRARPGIRQHPRHLPAGAAARGPGRAGAAGSARGDAVVPVQADAPPREPGPGGGHAAGGGLAAAERGGARVPIAVVEG